MYYIYVIRNKISKRFYTGFTKDLRKRIDEHNKNKVFSTKNRGENELIYYEGCMNIEDARNREKYLKTGMGKRYLKNRLKRFLSLPEGTGHKNCPVTGFTLIEILLALAILSIGLVSILSLFIVGVHSAKTAVDVTRAAMAAQMTLETIKANGYQNLSTGTQTMSDMQDCNNNDVYSEFTRELTVADNPINYITNWKSAELKVKYKNNNKEIARFMTYITKYEP